MTAWGFLGKGRDLGTNHNSELHETELHALPDQQLKITDIYWDQENSVLTQGEIQQRGRKHIYKKSAKHIMKNTII